MPIMRNPFRKQDENVRPPTSGAVPTVNGVATTEPIEIKEKEQPAEYKLSEINDSGVFIPPSPPERKSFWTTSSSRSTTSSNPRSVFDEREPFNISRESFDSYRRSFDISARSPIIQPSEQQQQRGRASLDSRTFLPPPPRNSNSFHRPLQVPGTQQEVSDELEEVALDDPKPAAPKKRGMLSRIMDGDSHAHPERPSSNDGTSKGSAWHHFGGRKRGQSGQGAELGSIPKPEETVKPPVGSQVKKEDSQPKRGEVSLPQQAVQQTTQTQPQATQQKSRQGEQLPEQPPTQPKALQPEQKAEQQAEQQVTSGAEKENTQAPAIVNGVS